ncbi:MAG TPA: helix-turn-helix domain-containing protein [Firmicutes bacterium]|nr:helix-turn-helix domain-containing protein [Bacillota bacterium]
MNGDFGNTLRGLISEKEINQKELARKIDVDPSVVSLWLSGKRMPNADSLCRLADYFGVSVDFLLGREDPWMNA